MRWPWSKPGRLSAYERLQNFLLEHDTEIFSYAELMETFGESDYNRFKTRYCRFSTWRENYGSFGKLESRKGNVIALEDERFDRGATEERTRFLRSADQTPFTVSTLQSDDKYFAFYLSDKWEFHFEVPGYQLPLEEKSPALFFNPEGFCFYLHPDFCNVKTVTKKLVVRAEEKWERQKQENQLASEEQAERYAKIQVGGKYYY